MQLLGVVILLSGNAFFTLLASHTSPKRKRGFCLHRFVFPRLRVGLVWNCPGNVHARNIKTCASYLYCPFPPQKSRRDVGKDQASSRRADCRRTDEKFLVIRHCTYFATLKLATCSHSCKQCALPRPLCPGDTSSSLYKAGHRSLAIPL